MGEAKTYFSTERIQAFSDGVFAISITLLALQFDIPDGDNPTEILAKVKDEVFDYGWGYVLGFVIIGQFWIAHHQIMERATRATTGLLWLHLAFLIGIAFMPFSTGLLSVVDMDGAKEGMLELNRFTVILYALTVMYVGFALSAVILRISTSDSFSDETSKVDIRGWLTETLVTPFIFLLSIPVAIFSDPSIAMYMWIGIFVAQPMAQRWARKS